MDRHVVLVVDEVAQGVTDGTRLEQAGRQLVEERLERVVVVPVDEDDVHVRVPELERCAEPSEAPAEDEDARTLRHGGHARAEMICADKGQV